MSDEQNQNVIKSKGVVKFFNDSKGFGFIHVADESWEKQAQEVFVHQTKIAMAGHRTLVEEQHVHMEYQEEAKGLKATSVTPDEDWLSKNQHLLQQKQQDNRGRGRYDDRYGGGSSGGYGNRGGGYDDPYNQQYRYDDRRYDNRGGNYQYGGGGRGDYGHY